MKLLQSFLIAYTSLIFIVGCQKEISRMDQPSQGTLQKDPSGNCSPFNVGGAFRVSSTLNTTHFIEVQVNITEPGSYGISTDTINGYSFLAQGFIDVPGLHTIRLAASGTPGIAGEDSFTISYNGFLSLTACKVKVSVLALNLPAAYTFATTGSSCTGAVVSGTYTTGMATTTANNVSVSVNVSSVGSYNITTPTVNGLSFAANGDFVSTGSQTILMSASGTPIAAGVSNYSLTGNASTCSFPVTVVGSQAAATFTLNGAGGTCTNFNPSGNYIVGTPLAASNTVVINVNVTNVGAYLINTNTINGVTFSGAGSFTTTGPQTVLLTGTGTPIAAGPATHSVTVTSSTCTFAINYQSGNPVPPPTGPAVYTYVGHPGACVDAIIAGLYIVGTPLNSSNTLTLQVNVTTAGTYMIASQTQYSSNGIQFLKMGTFTTTGIQNVVLPGSGVPTNVGIYQYSPTSPGGSVCTFNVKANTAIPIDFFVATIANERKSFNVQAKATYLIPSSKLLLTGLAMAGSPESFSLEIDRSAGGGTITAMAYTNNASNPYSLSATYIDATGAVWKPSDGSVNPRDLILIVITNITATSVEGTFQTTVRNNGGNGSLSKHVRDASFSIPIQ